MGYAPGDGRLLIWQGPAPGRWTDISDTPSFPGTVIGVGLALDATTLRVTVLTRAGHLYLSDCSIGQTVGNCTAFTQLAPTP